MPMAVRDTISAMLRYVRACTSCLNKQQHTTDAQFQDLIKRLSKMGLGQGAPREGQYDFNTTDDNLTGWEFRFLRMTTGKYVVKFQCHTSLEKQAQERDIGVLLDK